ncbi:hypothetical protein Trydic_g8195 [Trypoxylus dichotomus]
MNNINKREGRRKFGKPRYGRNQTKKYKSDVKPEQLTEQDVGITEYISQLKGFSGILKARFSDFQVNEINSDGEVAYFTDNNIPEGFNLDSPNKDIVIPKETPSDDIPQHIWDEILAVVIDGTQDKEIELDSTDFDKEKRGNIHRIVKDILQKKVVASTITRDDKKYITFKKYNKEDKVDNRITWPIDREEYVHFIVYKENIDTMEAALKIGDCLRMNASNFNYAGVKDRRAKTTQWFSVRKLQGNRFRIALRNIEADDDLIDQTMHSLKEKGFINYYGLQRFGNVKEVPTYQIGIKLLLGDFKEACSLILKCKKCDNPDSQLLKAKKKYMESGDAKSAVELLKEHREGNSLEYKLLQGLAESNTNDYVTALENIPRNTRLLYINAFQALVWNKIISRRIKEFGLQPIVGDLVIIKDTEGITKSSSMETDEPNNIEEDNVEDPPESTSRRNLVKVLTNEDLERYSIYDVVLPMPGYDITYPDNIVKEWYKNTLEEHGLTLEMPKQSVKTYSLSGTYRPMVKKVTNLSWKIMHYDDPNDNLLLSDYEKFLNTPEPVDKPDGKFKALILDFCLSSSCYATMLVREILKTDTSATAQTKLNDYHTKKEPSKIVVTQTEQQGLEDLPAPNSLLADSAKYEDFKKAIFGVTSNDDSLKRKTEDTDNDGAVPEKKSKEDGETEAVGLKTEPSLM